MIPKTTLPVAVTASALFLGACAGPALFGESGWPPQGESGSGYAVQDSSRARVQSSAAERGLLSRTGTDVNPRLPRDPDAPVGIDLGDEITSQPAALAGRGSPIAADTGGGSLHAWDGGAVPGPEAGVVADGAPTHGLEPSGAGRMHILELYQQRIDERDALVEEVDDLRALVRRLEKELEGSRSGSADQSLQIAALEAERDRLLRENAELAGRLTTAQIRRLEAEKILLQTRIAHERARASGPAPTTGSSAPGARPTVEPKGATAGGATGTAGATPVARDGR